jgi:spermidine synthase
VIGVILGGMSVGYFVGGHLADRFAPRRILGLLFLLASAFSLVVLWSNEFIGTVGRPQDMPWPMWVLLTVTITFLPAACMLGTISPVVAKMALDEHRGAGSTVGNIYAWGAVGSIAGVFLTGFVLIDQMGSTAIICAVAGGLALLGAICAAGQRRWQTIVHCLWILYVGVVSVPAVANWSPARHLGFRLYLRQDFNDYYDESNYYTIRIDNDVKLKNTKVLTLDNLIHAYVPMDDPTRLEYDYEKVYAAITKQLAQPDQPIRTLSLGGGGFVFPRYIETTYANSQIDVAEIDPAVKLAALQVLTLPEDDKTRIRTHIMDARKFLDDLLRNNQTSDKPVRYDFIYGDAFNDFSIPFHLTTREFNEKVRQLMSPDGAYLQNVIDIYQADACRFLSAYVATVRETFPYVYVFCSAKHGPQLARDTFIVACSLKRLKLDDLSSATGDAESIDGPFAWSEEGELGGDMATLLGYSRGVVLTDDYAPVDNLLAPVILDRFKPGGG